MYVEQNRKLMKNSGLFSNMAKWCFLGFFFEVLMLLWCLLGVSGIAPSVKNACFVFPFLGAFVGWVILVCLGLEGLGVLVFLCLFFIFFVGFVSVFFVLFLFCFWIVFGVGSCFVFVFFIFWGGFKGQVRWPKGPPHLALNPPYVFVFLFVFLSLFLIEKPLFFPLKRPFWFIYQCFPLFLFSLFWTSAFFPFLFLCLSLVRFSLLSFLFFISVFGFCFSSWCSFKLFFCLFVFLFLFFCFLFLVLFCFES